MLSFILIVIQPILQFKFEYFFYIIGILIFIAGIFFSSKPVFVHPMKSLRIKGSDDHDSIVYFAFSIGLFCILIPFMQNIFKTLYIWLFPNNFLVYLYFFSYLIGLYIGIFYVLLIISCVLIGIVNTIKKRRSLRPIYCERCQHKLRLINNSLIDFLDEKEIIAMRIKSICFEAWYCQSCSRKIERNSIHLRAYVSLSDKFKLCQDCNELTMTKTSKILKKATTEEEGIKLIVYTCNCCYKKEEKTEKIPFTPIDHPGIGL